MKSHRHRLPSLAALCLCAALAPAALRAAKPLPETVSAALRRALDADASWTLQKTLVNPPVMLVSTGVVSCCAGTGIVWRTLAPFPSTMTMTEESLSIESEDTNETKALRDLPHYARIRDMADRLAAGDSRPLMSMMEAQWLPAPAPDALWMLSLRPRNASAMPLFTSLTLSGRDTLDRATFLCPDGGTIALSFTETGRGTHSLWRPAAPAEPPAEKPAEPAPADADNPAP